MRLRLYQTVRQVAVQNRIISKPVNSKYTYPSQIISLGVLKREPVRFSLTIIISNEVSKFKTRGEKLPRHEENKYR